MKAIEESKRLSKKKAAKLLRVARTCVRECSRENDIREEFETRLRSSKRCRVSGGGDDRKIQRYARIERHARIEHPWPPSKHYNAMA